jgi:hypothetical protein
MENTAIKSNEQEIREHYNNRPLARQDVLNSRLFVSISQYGYTLKCGFTSKQAAENYTIDYYSERMNLIRQ